MNLKVKFGKILRHDVCLVAHVKFSQNENHFIDCKIGPQNHKMNYTRNLPSNSVLWTKNLKRDWSKRDRKSSKRKPRKGTAGDGLCHPSTHGPVVVHASHSADPSLILTDPFLVLVLRRPIFLLIDSHQAKRTKERATQGQRERERPITWTRDRLHCRLGHASHRRQEKLDFITNLPSFHLPPSTTHVTDLPFFSLPMSSKSPQEEQPIVT